MLWSFAWRMGRRFPRKWGRRTAHELSAPKGAPPLFQFAVVEVSNRRDEDKTPRLDHKEV